MRTRKSARKLCGKCRGEVNKRGRKGDERAESRMKEMESEEAKRIENETSDRFRDWFQLWVMIAAEVCVCTGRWLIRAALRGNSIQVHHACEKIKKALHP